MITHYLNQLRHARVLVVGDIMLDHYWSGTTERISPEAPVPVVKVSGEEYRAGGAANVAVNITALGANAILLGHVGQDQRADELAALLRAKKVDYRPMVHKDRATISKLRILSQDQQLIRIDFDDMLPREISDSILPVYQTALSECDIVILSDYGKGTLACVAELILLARAMGKPVLVDPKSHDFTIYSGATIITPNLKEFKQANGLEVTHTYPEEVLLASAQTCLQTLGLESLLITRGKNGMSLVQENADPIHLPTLAREVYDVSGAGDTVIATLAVALAADMPIANAAHLANTAAGLVVAKLGTATVSYEELVHASTESLLPQRGVVSLENCEQLRAVAKAQGKRVVMTNGCFDLLHQGHLQYLTEAKALGDYLIVAVNSDSSVRKLKGPSRPINPLSDRMSLLAALHVVDWVIPFEEETPALLYKQLAPDVIVKGGDYKVHEVVGHEYVLAAGGEVKILSFVPGYSSTKIIEKARREEEV